MRFHDIDGGDIFVDGHNVKDFTKEDLRANSAWYCRIPGCLMAQLWKISAMGG